VTGCLFLSPISFGQAKEIGSPSREKRLGGKLA